MSISLEALAMMGGDYVKDGISFEEHEKYEEQVPPYLLVDDQEDEYEKYEEQVPPYLLVDDQEDEYEKFFSKKKNIYQENLPTKKLYEHSFSSRQEFLRKRENNDELLAPRLEKGKQKKPLIEKHINFWEVLKKKDLSSFLETSRNNHCIMSS
ncbi:hypothetical protein R3W88_028740 [Solanum pinnatisectum]|uniref:Uncharacterized protein n=1 Tax=Solanum pinnatisectum TaxID=50273 RepID=A0AAV9K3B0_9SOLN|nr:hypothetical protein R3W88_028740 [Solanum pinnatisectum]